MQNSEQGLEVTSAQSVRRATVIQTECRIVHGFAARWKIRRVSVHTLKVHRHPFFSSQEPLTVNGCLHEKARSGWELLEEV